MAINIKESVANEDMLMKGYTSYVKLEWKK